MKGKLFALLSAFYMVLIVGCSDMNKLTLISEQEWLIESQEDWEKSVASQSNMQYVGGTVVPTDSMARYRSTMRTFTRKKSVQSIKLTQPPDWLDWKPVANVGPSNLGDAPIALQLGEGNYWMFGRYQRSKSQQNGTFASEEAALEGFDVALVTTPFEHQFDAPGGLMPGKGGYHAWQSRDMKNWVHHGPVSETASKWMTTAEYKDGKFYLYYDFPNDQDPHLFIDEDLTDGLPGENLGLAFDDPSDGSDCAVIRDLEGNFHLIVEDWSPINASTHSWDSPLASRAVSSDGIGNFKIMDPAVDERTKPTGKFAEYAHPHWHKEHPARFPGKTSTSDIPQHRIKAGDVRAFAKYEIHEPEQDAFGDWAAISIGGQYYLFADYDRAGKHGRENMSVAWFTSDDITKPFTFCSHIGQGHPDPDILFAEGQFYLITQMDIDYVSTGPWVGSVRVRVGVDTNDDGVTNQWTDWQELNEQYYTIEGFAKQIGKTPAQVEIDLPEGFGFQFEIELIDTTENESMPIIDDVSLLFEE